MPNEIAPPPPPPEAREEFASMHEFEENKASTEQQLADVRRALAAMQESADWRGRENRLLAGFISILVVCAALVAHGDIKGGDFTTAVIILGGAFYGWLSLRAAREADSAVGQSIRPPKKKGLIP